ncbi:MAG: hypothetical protein VYA30_02945 [Myxococcota bacterium]|nr:hypothetical protein [Myxococcota bacterium]
MRFIFIYFGLISACGAQLGCSLEQTSTETIYRTLDQFQLAHASGVAIDEASGTTYILDAESGIFKLQADGTAKQLWVRSNELPRFTDICVIGGGRFVLAADGDGYIIDLALGSAKQHFCLEPGWDPDFDDALRHQNRAVACDLTKRMIYGQPQTVNVTQGNEPVRSEIATYSLVSGEDIEWRPLPNPTFQAGGMLLLSTGNLLMGSGHSLTLFKVHEGTLTPLSSLASFNVQDIAGLTFDRQTNSLVILDGIQGLLIEIDVNSLPEPTRGHFQ